MSRSDPLMPLPADRAGWPAPGGPGLAGFWLGIHAGLRGEAAAAVAALARMGGADPAAGRDFARALGAFLSHLDAHHRIEDGHYFPRFRALDPAIGAAIDRLEADHAAIHDAIERAVATGRALLDGGGAGSLAAARAALDALVTAVDRHLSEEEDAVIPLMLAHPAA